MKIFTNTKSYLDYSSGAIIHSAVSKLVSRLMTVVTYNPASIHSGGLIAKKTLEDARSSIAGAIGSHTDEIIFTGSGTESIAMAIIGTVMEAKKTITLPNIVTTTIEHSSILETCKMLESRGLTTVTYISPDDETGKISALSIKNAVNVNTVLVSVAQVNGEIGIVQDVESYIKVLNKIKEEKYKLESIRFSNTSYYPYLHIDACQSFAHIDISPLVRKGIDLISFNSIKIGGPSGIGSLYKRRGASLENIYAGGQQEMGLRPGTQSPFLAAGFALAAQITKDNLVNNENNYKELKELLLTELNKVKKEYEVDFIENSNEYSLPSIVNISFPYFSGQQMAIELDARGVMVSSKSACKNENENESYVIAEIRKKQDNKTYNIYGSIRISFGPDTKKKDIIKLINALKAVLVTYKGVLY